MMAFNHFEPGMLQGAKLMHSRAGALRQAKRLSAEKQYFL